MSEIKPPDPKPVVIIDVQHYHHGERWFSYVFKVEKFIKPLIVYGSTQQEAEDHLHVELRALYGKLGYTIKIMEAPSVTQGT